MIFDPVFRNCVLLEPNPATRTKCDMNIENESHLIIILNWIFLCINVSDLSRREPRRIDYCFPASRFEFYFRSCSKSETSWQFPLRLCRNRLVKDNKKQQLNEIKQTQFLLSSSCLSISSLLQPYVWYSATIPGLRMCPLSCSRYESFHFS